MAYIGIGSNLGNRKAHIESAIRYLARLPGTCLCVQSDIYETEPVGPISQEWFLNTVVGLRTELHPVELLREMQRIEQRMGRQRDPGMRWGPRIIDLDILLYGDRCVESEELTLPHPHMHERRFVLEPLCQIAPDVVHPGTGRTIRALFAALDDDKEVRHLPS